jgi:hypothetical protein
MLGYKRSREGRRNTNETVERKIEAAPDGSTVTTETIYRETEEEFRESEQQLYVEAETLRLAQIPVLRQCEENKMKERQQEADNLANMRYLFPWIETDIERCKTPLPLISPAQMEQKGWPVIEGPELIWVPLYWRATRRNAVVDLPDLLWISEIEDRAGGLLWACCDFQWSDDGRALRQVWVPELLLRTYPPYVGLVNAASQQKIRTIYSDMEYAGNKRIGLLQNPGLPQGLPPGLPQGLPVIQHISEEASTKPAQASREAVEQLFDHPEKLIPEMQKIRDDLKNVLVPHVQDHLNTLSLTEQLFFLGDPAFVVSRYYVAAMDGGVNTGPLPRIQVANFVEGTKIRCQVQGLEDPVWLSIALILAAHRQCQCDSGSSCSCRWRAVEVGYDAITKFICG